jgi:transcriptional regulator
MLRDGLLLLRCPENGEGALNLAGRKVKKEFIPEERNETIRQELLRLLDGRELPVGVLSKEVRKSEKEIYEYLEQIGRTAALNITPAECRNCGYVFAKRHRPKKPGKCPICKGTHIEQPLFSIASKG